MEKKVLRKPPTISLVMIFFPCYLWLFSSRAKGTVLSLRVYYTANTGFNFFPPTPGVKSKLFPTKWDKKQVPDWGYLNLFIVLHSANKS